MTDVFDNPYCLLAKEPLPLEKRLGAQLAVTVAELL
jgi:hypothetical protein